MKRALRGGWVAAAGLFLASAVWGGADPGFPWETWRDLDRLSRLPPGEQTLLRSSHCQRGCRFDRHSEDEPRFLWVEGDEGTIFAEEGAGAISRMWFTQGDGSSEPLDPTIGLRIYLDGASSPVVDLPLASIFDGSSPPFVAPLVGNRDESSGGFFSYVPIPYRQGCRVVLVGAEDKKIWYQVGFHRRADAAGVVSYTGAEELSSFSELLGLQGADPWPEGSGQVSSGSVDLGPGASIGLVQRGEPGSLTLLRLRDVEGLLDEVEVRLRFDGRETVRMAARDFFAIGREGPLPTRSLLVGKDDQGWLYSYFPMPFFQSLEVELARGPGGDSSFEVDWEVRLREEAPPGDAGLFEAVVAATSASTTGIDFPWLALEGQGRVVGLFLELGSLTGNSRIYVEGDERLFVDRSLHPTWYGTGVEDQFNGGFAFDMGPFSRALHGAPYTVLQAEGAIFTGAYRLHLTDGVTFGNRLRAGLEGGPTGDLSMRVRAVSYFYRRPARLFRMDHLDLGDPEDRVRHDYAADGAFEVYELDSFFEGEPPSPLTASGVRREAGAASFRLDRHPTANHLRLRRRYDAGAGLQRARILAFGQEVGEFPAADVDLDRRWQEVDVDLGPFLGLGTAIPFVIEAEDDGSDFPFSAFRYELWGDRDPSVFADGFESGDTAAWSATSTLQVSAGPGI